MTAPSAPPAAERGQVAVRLTRPLRGERGRRVPARITGSARPRRRATASASALRYHRARPIAGLIRQFSSPLLILLIFTAALSYVLGRRADAVIIGLILAASAGLGFAAVRRRAP